MQYYSYQRGQFTLIKKMLSARRHGGKGSLSLSARMCISIANMENLYEIPINET